MPSSSKMWQRCGWKGVCRRRSGDIPPQRPIPVHVPCAGILSPLLSYGEGTGLVSETDCATEQKAKPCLRQKMVVCIECRPRPHTLLQGCGCVCLVRPGRVNPGREHRARESKAQEAPALLQLFFPDATERTPKALLWKQQRSAVCPKPNTTVKA